MMHGTEERASLREIIVNALALHAGEDDASDVIVSSLLRLSYEQDLLIEYLTGSEQDAPLSDHIIEGIGEGIVERIRSLAALVSTQMDVTWKAEAPKAVDENEEGPVTP